MKAIIIIYLLALGFLGTFTCLNAFKKRKKLGRYRMIEVRDKLINNGNPFWRVEKHVLGLWWTEYFEEHSENGATYYKKEEAEKWYNYHCDNSSRIEIKVIAQNR